jgi:hypothetical protein
MSKTEKNGGYMTILASLLFLVTISVLFIILNQMVIHQGEAKSRIVQVGAGEHILANYNVPLAERYHLYFLDPRMEGNMESRAKKYYQEVFSPNSLFLLGSSTLIKMKVKDIQIESYGTMQEQKYLYLRHEIREFMKYDTAKDLLSKIIGDSAEEVEEQNNVLEDLKGNIGEAEDEAEQAQQEESTETALAPTEQQELARADAQKNDPRKIIKEILSNGVLTFVMDGKEVSDKTIPTESLPSGILKEKNEEFSTNLFENISEMKSSLSQMDGKKAVRNLTDQVYTYAYTQKYFNYYGKEEKIEDTVLDYELEYILGGQESDKGNLKYVVHRLLLLRFALNMVYAVTSKELKAQALVTAEALSLGVQGVAQVVEYAILGAVSFAEALLDVKNLIKGNQVPILKSKDSWKLSLSNVAAIKEEGNDKDQKGLTYEQYLLLILALRTSRDKLYLRMQDIMQTNIRQEQSDFLINQCRFGITMKSKVQVKNWFSRKYTTFQNQRVFSY